jgi:hypothetical protein
VDFLRIEPERTTTVASRSVDVLPQAGGALDVALPWGPTGRTAQVRIDAAGRLRDDGGSHEVALQTVVTLGGQRVHWSRRLELAEGATTLADVFEGDGLRLVLALSAEAATRPVIVRPSALGPSILFRLAVERVLGERFVPLETNRLQTFLEQGVEYSFRRGEGADAESVRLWLRPMRIEGDVVELELEIAGSLPGDPDRLILSRRDTVFSSKGATSPVVVATGTPPAGYRFLITPEF